MKVLYYTDHRFHRSTDWLRANPCTVQGIVDANPCIGVICDLCNIFLSSCFSFSLHSQKQKNILALKQELNRRAVDDFLDLSAATLLNFWYQSLNTHGY